MHWHRLEISQKNNSHIEVSVGLLTTSDMFFWQKANHRIHKDQHVLQTKGSHQPLQPDTAGGIPEILQPICSCQFKRHVETPDGIH